MEATCLRVTELPHVSKLFADFVYHFDRVDDYYEYPPHVPDSYRAAAARVDYPAGRRAALVAALREQNGDSPALEALARPDTLAVVTGQQVGLFSGPCYTVYKALTAAAAARRLTESGIPAVPVFWLATEDHDFAEVNHCWVFDAAHQPVRLEAPAANSTRRPVGGIPIDPKPVAALRAALNGFPFGGEVGAMVEEAYAPGRTFGAAFAALMRSMLASQGLLYLDPMHPASRALAAPLIREALLAAPDLTAAVRDRSRALVAAGYHAQVHFEERTSFVFLIEEGRRIALERQGADYFANGRRLSTAELTGRAEQLSPNALLRPVVQDYLLPTVTYVGGPAELAYLAQAQVLYRELLGRMPVAVHRQSATLLDARSAKLLARYGLSLPDVFHGEEILRERMARTLIPPPLAGLIGRTRAGTARALDELGAALAGFDRTLAAAFEKSRRKMEYQLSKTEGKVAREALRRDERAGRDAAWLAGLIFPHKRLQERFYSILPFLARHGPGLIDNLAAVFGPDCPDHRALVL